ncbi:hypothetical protein [Aquipuribacter sp. SD81]|uniref:hypothetical protein n=1 Tax=Aquipuribacter sp. SD81 TaxID=3127703 RepID=UPI00301969BE
MTLPRSALLAAWAGAVAAGRAGASEALAAVAGDDEPHRVAWATDSLPPPELPVPDDGWLSDLLVLLAAAGERAPVTVRCLLPRPGDLRGLPGPGSLHGAAVDAGECVAVDLGAAGGDPLVVWCVPEIEEFGPAGDVGRLATWRLWRAGPVVASALPTSLPEADQAFRLALADAADALERLDAASWRPDEAVQAASAVSARRDGGAPLPPTVGPRSLRLLTRAEHVLAIADVAEGTPGGTVNGWEAAQREQALAGLARAARDAVAAAVSLPG